MLWGTSLFIFLFAPSALSVKFPFERPKRHVFTSAAVSLAGGCILYWGWLAVLPPMLCCGKVDRMGDGGRYNFLVFFISPLFPIDLLLSMPTLSMVTPIWCSVFSSVWAMSIAWKGARLLNTLISLHPSQMTSQSLPFFLVFVSRIGPASVLRWCDVFPMLCCHPWCIHLQEYFLHRLGCCLLVY